MTNCIRIEFRGSLNEKLFNATQNTKLLRKIINFIISVAGTYIINPQRIFVFWKKEVREWLY